jgi:hypothetical protein
MLHGQIHAICAASARKPRFTQPFKAEDPPVFIKSSKANACPASIFRNGLPAAWRFRRRGRPDASQGLQPQRPPSLEAGMPIRPLRIRASGFRIALKPGPEMICGMQRPHAPMLPAALDALAFICRRSVFESIGVFQAITKFIRLKRKKMGRILWFFLFAAAGALCFHFGGWKFLWGSPWISAVHGENFSFNKLGLFIEINQKAFALLRTGRYFNFPPLQWIMLGATGALFFNAVRSLFSIAFIKKGASRK